jgi:hypothetical protein
VNLRLLIAGAAVLGCTALGLGATAALATPAATTACGNSCVDISFLQPGSSELLKVHDGLSATNTVFALNQGGNNLPAEDLTPTAQGTVGNLYCDPAGEPYTGSLFTANQCHALIANGYKNDETWQLEYNPDKGGPGNMCLGDWDGTLNAPSGYKARLEACGVNASTVQILANHLPGGITTAPGYVWIINGGSDNFSNPLVLSVANTLAWQSPRWETVVFNGNGGVDVQEAVGKPGPF